MRVALALLALAALAAGAVAGASAGGGTPSVALTVRYEPGDGRAPSRATLRCAGGDARGTGRLRAVATRACRVARTRRERLHGPRSTGPCTEIYGGPQTARVTGTVGSRRVARRFDRTDGCRMAEWDALVPLLPRASGVGP